MEKRFKMAGVEPNAYKVMDGLDKFVANSQLLPLHRELIKIRASQINGCAFCISYHTKSARALGESEERIYLISAWREAGEIFTEEEKLLLAMTEEITLIHKQGLSTELYNQSISLFGELTTAHVIMTIITINAWNRIGVSLNMTPKL